MNKVMPHLLRVQVLGALALSCGVSTALGAALARGVPPEKQEAFAAAGKSAPIKCVSAAGDVVQLPTEALNDDFCDCADGSDEPGTGACAGQEATMFYCPNEKGTPQVLYASRVDDGVCDCCDGSDEAGLAARRPERPRCENSCAEQGEREKAERAAKMEKLKVGLAKKTEAVARLAQSKPTWDAELAVLEAKTTELDASLVTAKAAAEKAKKEEDAKKEAEAAEKEGSGGGSGIQGEVEVLRKTVEQQQQQIKALRQEVDALKAKAKGAAGGGSEEPAAVEEKKQVSEYAKWMEGAGETPGAIKDQEEGDFTPDEGGDDDDMGDEEEDASSRYASASSKGGGADQEVRKVEQTIRDNKKAAEALKKKIKLFAGDESRMGYASLESECLELHDGQYKYSVCFDGEAKQDYVSLGKNFEWKGAREAHFTDGQMCPGGPARMLRVLFQCGGESKIMDIIEPSRCVYEARISNPGACDAEDAEKLARPPVKHPKDEL